MDNLFEAAEDGKLDSIRLLLQKSEAFSERKPWLPARINDTTLKFQQTALHICVFGAINAVRDANTDVQKAKQRIRDGGRTTINLSNYTKAQEEIGKVEKKFSLSVNFLLQKSEALVNEQNRL